MARDDPDWGYTRIRDALANLGHEIARGTVQAILRSSESIPHRSAPSESRGRRSCARTGMPSRPAISSRSRFSPWTGLTRFYVLFVITPKTRRVEIAGTPGRAPALLRSRGGLNAPIELSHITPCVTAVLVTQLQLPGRSSPGAHVAASGTPSSIWCKNRALGFPYTTGPTTVLCSPR